MVADAALGGPEGPRSAEDAAESIVRLAPLPPDSPTGGVFLRKKAFDRGRKRRGRRKTKKNLDRLRPVVVKRIIFSGKRFNGQKAPFKLVVVVEQKERRGLPVNRP
jgi:hypothetical protein